MDLIAEIEDLKQRVAALERKKRSTFERPTVEMVAAYCAERKKGIDAEEWYDHHERSGWLVGKNKTPMKNWQAAVRTWEHSRKKEQGNGNGGGTKAREELIAALKDNSNRSMPNLSMEAKALFFSLKKRWASLQDEVQSGIVAI